MVSARDLRALKDQHTITVTAEVEETLEAGALAIEQLERASATHDWMVGMFGTVCRTCGDEYDDRTWIPKPCLES